MPGACLGVNSCGGLYFQDVGVDNGDVGLIGELLSKDGYEPLVEFDGDDASGPCGQLMGQSAKAGADFEDAVGWQEIGCIGDSGEVGRVDEEVLAKRLLEIQIVATQQFEG